MLSELERQAKLDKDLSVMDEDALNRLYLRVFQNDDGELVLRDLANRTYVNISTSVGADKPDQLIYREGVRSVYLSIQTRLFNGVSGKKEASDV